MRDFCFGHVCTMAMRIKCAVATAAFLAGSAVPAGADYDSALTALIHDERILAVGWTSGNLLVEVTEEGLSGAKYIGFICDVLAEHKVTGENGNAVKVQVSYWTRPYGTLASEVCPAE